MFGFRGNKFGTYTATEVGITVAWTNTSHYYCHEWEDTTRLKSNRESMAAAEEQILTWEELGGPPCHSNSLCLPSTGHVQVIVRGREVLTHADWCIEGSDDEGAC